MSKFDLSNIKFVEIPSKGIFRFLRFSVNDKNYIVKALKEEFRDRRQYIALLKKEFDAVVKLQSPFLPVYCELVEDSTLGRCIVEDYIEGRNITEYLKEHHTVEEQEQIANQLIDALQSVHRRFVVFRNLNPDNVLITKQDDSVKLIGFRPSFADEIQAPYTSTRFLAPEQKDETVSVDSRSDIYSLGLILRQMNLPDNFASVVAKCCSLGRTDRYMYAEDVTTALSARNSVDVSRVFKLSAVVVVVALLVVGIVCFVKNGLTRGADTPEEATAYILPDTLKADTAKVVSVADSVSVPPLSGCNVDSVKRVIATKLEAIYANTQGDSALVCMRIEKQVRNCYHIMLHSLGRITMEERDAIDHYFAKYRNNKDEQLSEQLSRRSNDLQQGR